MESDDVRLEIKQGYTFRHRLRFTSGGQPMKLDDGRTYRGWIMAKIGGVKLADLEFEVPDQTNDPGTLFLKLSKDATAKIPCNPSPYGMRLPTAYLYDIEVTYASGENDRAAKGEAIVSPRAGPRA